MTSEHYCSARIWYNWRLSHSCLSKYFAIKHSQIKGISFYLHLCYVIECTMELSLWKYYSIIWIWQTAESDEVKSDWGLAVYFHPIAIEQLVISKWPKAALIQVSVHWLCLHLYGYLNGNTGLPFASIQRVAYLFFSLLTFVHWLMMTFSLNVTLFQLGVYRRYLWMKIILYLHCSLKI